jgi:hypothetical protein
MALASESDAVREFAYNAGAAMPQREWIVTPWDTWERNPHYVGRPGPHPEDDGT